MNKVLKEKDIAKICDFKFDINNEVIYKKYLENGEKEKIKDIFLKNVKKYTFLGLIFPCVTFLCIFLITILFIVWKEINGNFKVIDNLYLLFLACLFLILGLCLLFKWKKRKVKCYISMYYDSLCYKYISDERFKKICLFLNERN